MKKFIVNVTMKKSTKLKFVSYTLTAESETKAITKACQFARNQNVGKTIVSTEIKATFKL